MEEAERRRLDERRILDFLLDTLDDGLAVIFELFAGKPDKVQHGEPAPRKICFIAILSMPMAEPSTPEDAYGIFAISSRP